VMCCASTGDGGRKNLELSCICAVANILLQLIHVDHSNFTCELCYPVNPSGNYMHHLL
jgi:hypothetical protein